jgi:4-amino-4-deoxychorismate lyase
VQVSEKRLSSDDPWLRIKTTNRALYDAERAALPKGVDEWLFLNEAGHVCEGTITNIFVTLANGDRVTPPVTSGVLPGILRQQLVAQGWAERIVTPDDLRSAREIMMGNALRGLIRADIAPIA